MAAKVFIALLLLAMPIIGFAQDTPPPTANKGDTAWLLICSALVIFMTLPGLALFYGGLVRSKNVLSVLMQCLLVFSLVAVLWALYGYSLAFTTGNATKENTSRHCISTESTFLLRTKPP